MSNLSSALIRSLPLLLPAITLSCTPRQTGPPIPLATDKAVVHFVSDGSKVLAKFGSDRRSTLAVADRPNPAHREDVPLTLLTLGPTLDSPDRVAARSFIRKGSQLELEIAHTNARHEVQRLMANSLDPRLVELPFEGLPPGKYSLTVTWRAVRAELAGRTYRDPRPGDRPLVDVKPLVQEIRFQILPK